MSTTFTSDQLLKLAGVMEQKAVTPERFEQILASGILADVFEHGASLANREAVRQALKLGPLPPDAAGAGLPSEQYRIVVDFGMPLEQMIAAGNYDWKNEDIIANQFSVAGEGIVEYEARLFSFDRSVPSQDVEKAIREAAPAGQWEPGKIEHLLAFGAKYSEEQRKNPIVCLGSVSGTKVMGQRQVPYLYRRVTGRSLHLDWYGNGWHPFYRFLAIRKITPKTSDI